MESKTYYDIRIGNIAKTIGEHKILQLRAVEEWRKRAYQAFIDSCHIDLAKLNEERHKKFS